LIAEEPDERENASAGWIAAAATIAIGAIMSWPAPTVAQAQDFPNHPVRIIVGPSPDVFARIIAEHLQEAWKQPVVVETRPGGGGKLAVSAVTGAKPDGHTLLFATPTFTLATAMRLAPFDFVKDFEPAALTGLIAYALVVNPDLPVKSVADLVALAQAKPGEINCASAGFGTVPHLACETINKVAGAQVVHVPFKDVNSAMTGVMGNHVQMFVAVSTVARQQIAAGTVRGLAVTTAQRSTLLPELPTLAESGFPTFVMPGWGGLMAPAGTPKDVVDKINGEVQRAVQDPAVAQKLLAVGMEPPPAMSAAGFGTFIKDDIARWTALVDAVGVDKLKEQ
jgi:tripartite-type tricarboxylate transporter receptor subunit TctC